MKIPRCAIMDEQKVFIPRSIFSCEKEGPKNSILALCFRWNSRVVPFCMNKSCFRRGHRRFPWSPSRRLTENGTAKMQRKQKKQNPKQKQWDRQNAEQEQKEKRQIKPRADAKADVELTAMKARVSHLWEWVKSRKTWKIKNYFTNSVMSKSEREWVKSWTTWKVKNYFTNSGMSKSEKMLFWEQL